MYRLETFTYPDGDIPAPWVALAPPPLIASNRVSITNDTTARAATWTTGDTYNDFDVRWISQANVGSQISVGVWDGSFNGYNVAIPTAANLRIERADAAVATGLASAAFANDGAEHAYRFTRVGTTLTFYVDGTQAVQTTSATHGALDRILIYFDPSTTSTVTFDVLSVNDLIASVPLIDRPFRYRSPNYRR